MWSNNFAKSAAQESDFFFRELGGTSFYKELLWNCQKKRKNRHQLVQLLSVKKKCLLRRHCWCFPSPWGHHIIQVTVPETPDWAFSYCMHFWKETLFLKKGDWVRAHLAPRPGASVLLLWAVCSSPAGPTCSSVLLTFLSCVAPQPWEPQCFCSNFPHEAVCADPWGQALLVSTDAGVLLVDG